MSCMLQHQLRAWSANRRQSPIIWDICPEIFIVSIVPLISSPNPRRWLGNLRRSLTHRPIARQPQSEVTQTQYSTVTVGRWRHPFDACAEDQWSGRSSDRYWYSERQFSPANWSSRNPSPGGSRKRKSASGFQRRSSHRRRRAVAMHTYACAVSLFKETLYLSMEQ
jgi:hypothetical protein